MRWWVATAAVLAGLAPGVPVAGEEEWRRLDGAGISAVLSARAIGYADGTLQDFLADGRTLRGADWGDWRVTGARLCQRFPPETVWTCARVEVSTRGLDLRFTDATGAQWTGRYVDLR